MDTTYSLYSLICWEDLTHCPNWRSTTNAVSLEKNAYIFAVSLSKSNMMDRVIDRWRWRRRAKMKGMANMKMKIHEDRSMEFWRLRFTQSIVFIVCDSIRLNLAVMLGVLIEKQFYGGETTLFRHRQTQIGSGSSERHWPTHLWSTVGIGRWFQLLYTG